MKKWKKVMLFFSLLCLIAIIAIVGVNQYVKSSTTHKIREDFSPISDIDAILVLGCQVRADGSLSLMLQDRLDKAIKLYQDKVAPKIIVSGDHRKENYDEVNAMKNYLIEKGIESENIFMDHAGFSTYESMYRAKAIFEAKKLVVVTQEYHLYRSIYIGEKLGIETYGSPAIKTNYVGQIKREIREILARDKDFIKVMVKPEPTYLGEAIPVSGNGNATNDK